MTLPRCNMKSVCLKAGGRKKGNFVAVGLNLKKIKKFSDTKRENRISYSDNNFLFLSILLIMCVYFVLLLLSTPA